MSAAHDGALGNADVDVGRGRLRPFEQEQLARDGELQPQVADVAEPQLEARARARASARPPSRARRGRGPGTCCPTSGASATAAVPPLSGASIAPTFTAASLPTQSARQRAEVRVPQLAQHAAAGRDDPALLAAAQQQHGPLGRDDEPERVRKVAIVRDREHAGNGGEAASISAAWMRDEAAAELGRERLAHLRLSAGEPPVTSTSRSANIDVSRAAT